MKYFTCLITLLSFGICGFCQTPFEGIIKYELSDEKDSMIAYVSFYFKKDKITTAVETVDSQKVTGDNFAIDFSKNLIYHFIGKDKKYVIDTLKEESGQKNYLSQLVAKTNETKNILNNKSTLFTHADAGSKGFIENVTYNLWFADSLFYPAKEKYLYLDDLAMFVNGKTICLENHIAMTFAGTKASVKSKAIEIVAKPLDDLLFSIPAGYTYTAGSFYTEDNERYKTEVLDVKMEKIKSEPSPPLPPPARPTRKTTKKPLKPVVSKPKQ